MPSRALDLPLAAVVAGVLVLGCTDDSTEPRGSPLAGDSATTKMLDAGAAMIQGRAPIEAIDAYLAGFHFYNGRPDLQVEAHHYCAALGEDVFQCVVYDGNVAQARMIGVEYIISARLFAELPDEEKAMWHSHVFEVKSGQLVAPGLPDAAERELMEKLVGTYGKTWHTWHTGLDKSVPVGVPQLMMDFTAEGQADPEMIAERDARLDMDSARKREARQSIQAPAIDPGADAWRRDIVVQVEDPTGALHETGPAPKETKGTGSGTNPRSNRP